VPGVIIPIPLDGGAPLPYFDMQTQADGVTYTLEIRWNVRAGAWYMNVRNEAGDDPPLLAGLKLVADWPLAAYTTQRQPPGAFVVVDSAGLGEDPALLSLGVRHQLLYFTAAELGL